MGGSCEVERMVRWVGWFWRNVEGVRVFELEGGLFQFVFPSFRMAAEAARTHVYG